MKKNNFFEIKSYISECMDAFLMSVKTDASIKRVPLNIY